MDVMYNVNKEKHTRHKQTNRAQTNENKHSI